MAEQRKPAFAPILSDTENTRYAKSKLRQKTCV